MRFPLSPCIVFAFLVFFFDSALMEGYPQMSSDFYLYNQIINEVLGAGVIVWW